MFLVCTAIPFHSFQEPPLVKDQAVEIAKASWQKMGKGFRQMVTATQAMVDQRTLAATVDMDSEDGEDEEGGAHRPMIWCRVSNHFVTASVLSCRVPA